MDGLWESFIREDDQGNIVGSMFPISGPGLEVENVLKTLKKFRFVTCVIHDKVRKINES